MTMRTLSASPNMGSTTSSHIKHLRRVLLAAKLDLGERMYAAGIDDGSLGAQITDLDRRIRRADTARLPLGPLLTQRRELLLQLAAAAMEEEAPLPEAEAEYQRARKALVALKKEADVIANTPRPEMTSVGA
jgi:hypothetical protein